MVRLPQSPRGREARTLRRRTIFLTGRSSRLSPSAANWTRGASTRHTMVPRERRARLACLLLLHCAPAQVRGASASACTDEDSHCKQWQKMGECENNPGFMRAAMWKTSSGSAIWLSGGLFTVPRRASGCPELRPASANQPFGPGNIARPGLSSAQAPHVRPHVRHVREAACTRAAARVQRHRRRRARRGRRHRHHGAPRAED